MPNKHKPTRTARMRTSMRSSFQPERRNSTRLEIASRDARPEALKCAIDEWLIPALCRGFLQHKGLD